MPNWRSELGRPERDVADLPATSAQASCDAGSGMRRVSTGSGANPAERSACLPASIDDAAAHGKVAALRSRRTPSAQACSRSPPAQQAPRPQTVRRPIARSLLLAAPSGPIATFNPAPRSSAPGRARVRQAVRPLRRAAVAGDGQAAVQSAKQGRRRTPGHAPGLPIKTAARSGRLPRPNQSINQSKPNPKSILPLFIPLHPIQLSNHSASVAPLAMNSAGGFDLPSRPP